MMNIRQFFGDSASAKVVKTPVIKPVIDLNTKVDPFEENVKEFVYDMTRENVDLGISSITSGSAQLFGKYREWGGKIANEYLFINYMDRYIDELNATETGVNGIRRSEYVPVENTFDFVILKKHFGMRSKRVPKTPQAPVIHRSSPPETMSTDTPSNVETCQVDDCSFSGTNAQLMYHYGKHHSQHLISASSTGLLTCSVCHDYENAKPKSMYCHIAKCNPDSPFHDKKTKKACSPTKRSEPSTKRSEPKRSEPKRSAPSIKRNDMIRKTQIAEMKYYAEAKYNSEMEELQNQKMQIEARMEEIRSNFETTMSSMDGISAIEASRMYSEMLQQESESTVL